MTTEKLELSTKPVVVAAESDKSLKDLAVVHGACSRVEGLIRSILSQTMEAPDTSGNQAITQLVNLFRTGLENEYAGSQLAFPYPLAHVCGVEAVRNDVQCPAPPRGEGGITAATNPSMPVPPQPPTPPAKTSCGLFKNVGR